MENHSHNTTIETSRLLLRRWQETDAEALFRHASDPSVGPLAGWPPHRDVDESRTVIRDIFSQEGMWAVVLKGTTEPIGCVGYLPATRSNLVIGANDCEVGYWIARSQWGKGICTEALAAVVDCCLNNKHFNTLWGCYFPSNPASGRVMEKCGFHDTGTTTKCLNLLVGSDQTVKILKLERHL